MQGPLRDLLQFQLLAAVRPSEARMAQWTELDLETLRWIIPGQRMKNGQPHLVPLTKPVVEIVERMKGLGKEYVFPGEKPDCPFNLQALGHALRRTANKEILKEHKVSFFTPHDIRRTAATIMRRLGYGLVVDRVLAHSLQSVTDRHYDVHDYEPEKRTALEGLANHILAIQAKAQGENVEPVDFKKKRTG
jgi:integrase